MRLKSVALLAPAIALTGALVGFKGEDTGAGAQVISPIKTMEKEETSHISLKDLSPKERKKEFVKLMVPLIERANREVLKERSFILRVKGKKKLNKEEKEKLKALLEKYRATSIDELLKKVDSVPTGLVLAQGAIESGWGTSRFFTEANNAFGIYSFKGKNCLKAKNSSACLKVYNSLYDSVKDYIYNLNVGWAYERFRELRSKGADIYTLIESLHNYSERKDEYIKLVKEVVKKNGFDTLDSPIVASNSFSIQ